MCRAFCIFELGIDNWKDDIAKEQVVLSYVMNSYDKGNHDGYFIQIDNESFRSLDYSEFIKYILENLENIRKALIIHGHLRSSTNKCNDLRGVHGWQFGIVENEKFFCSHNGIVFPYKEHDSYEYFRKIEKNKINLKNIVRTSNEFNGWGTFLMIGEKKQYVISKGNKTNIHFLNGHFLVINSNDDIHEIKNNFDFKINKENPNENFMVGIINFYDLPELMADSRIIEFEDGLICSDRIYSFEDKVFEFENRIPKKSAKLKKEKFNSDLYDVGNKNDKYYYDKNYDYYYDSKGIFRCRKKSKKDLWGEGE